MVADRVLSPGVCAELDVAVTVDTVRDVSTNRDELRMGVAGAVAAQVPLAAPASAAAV